MQPNNIVESLSYQHTPIKTHASSEEIESLETTESSTGSPKLV